MIVDHRPKYLAYFFLISAVSFTPEPSGMEFCGGPMSGRAATSTGHFSRFFVITLLLITSDESIEGLSGLFDFGLGHILKVEQRVPRLRVDSDQLIEFEMKGTRVAALGALDQEDHQERDYSRSRVDHELPRIGPTE
jgi:hypothetical protein